MATISDYSFTARPGQLNVVQSCLLDATPEAIFKILIDPNLIPQWWGPAELVTTVDHMEPIPGGYWHYTQKDAAGEVYAFQGYYHIVNHPAQLVYTFEYENEPGHVLLEEITLQPVEGKTRITDTSVFLRQSDRDGMVEMGMESGARETFERIAALVSTAGNRSLPR